jgi:hypothetical protein
MCEFAERFDGKTQKERGRRAHSFYDDGGVASAARRREVHQSWLRWWDAHGAAIRDGRLKPGGSP